jgi:ubiquinone/menaquinone biosynthesis C-methylase UbiE
LGSFKASKQREVSLDDPLKQAKAKAAATYNAAADHFDDEPLGFWERIGRRTIERLALSTGANVLDVGCGTGASALPAAEAVGPNGFVSGVDLSARLLDRARGKAIARDCSNIEFRLADMTSLGYPDGHFDAVVSVFAIFFVPDMEGLVRELWRMVRPGGKLAVTTWALGYSSRPIRVGNWRSSRSGRTFITRSILGIVLPTSRRCGVCYVMAAS